MRENLEHGSDCYCEECRRPKIYIGDGVYAQFDGWYIWLTTERENGENRIALEPQMMTALLSLADKSWKRSEVRT